MKIKRRSFIIATAATLASIPLRGALANTTPVSEPIFDAHLHLFDPAFPVDSNAGYTPPVFTLADYQAIATPLGVRSGALVASSFHGLRQDWLTTALTTLGPQWVGITQLPLDVKDEEILRLDKLGVRGIRFNIYRGREIAMDKLVSLANRAFSLAGWHPEIYVDASTLRDAVPALSKLNNLVIDHLGMTEAGLPVLLDLVDAGAKVKATGFGRVNMDIPKALERIAQRSPDALMFGTDLPSTRAKRPFRTDDIALLKKVLGHGLARKALWDNGRHVYGLPRHATVSTVQGGNKHE